MPNVDARKLREWSAAILRHAGVTDDIAACVADHLVESNLVGVDSHGVVRVSFYVDYLRDGRIAKEDRMEVLLDVGAISWLDGHQTFGPRTASRASAMAVQKARTHGIGMVVAKNSAHIGRLGAYVEAVAAEGFIGFLCCNSQGAGQLVVPYGGKEPRLATNPLAWGIPTGTYPLVIDMSTSAAAEGKIKVKFRRKEPLPPGWAINADGRSITDPAEFYGVPPGSILPAAGYKGYGLSLVVDSLAGVLSGAGYARPLDYVHTPLNGFVFIAIDVQAVRPLEQFRREVDSQLDYVRSSAPIAEGTQVMAPNDPEVRERQRRLRDGVPIDDETWETLSRLAREAGVASQ